MYRTTQMTATERIMNDFETFIDMFVSGVPYKEIATYFNTSDSTMNMTVMPTLRGRQLISSNMEKKRKENLPKYIAEQVKLRHNRARLERNEKVNFAIKQINVSDLRYKILADCCIFGATDLAEVDAESLGLSTLSKNEQRCVTDYIRKRYKSSYKYERLMSKIYGLSDSGIFKEYIGQYYLSNDQRKGIEFVLSNLTDRQQRIIQYRVFNGLTYDAIAIQIGIVSGEAMRQQFNIAIQQMRHPRWHSYLINGYETTLKIHEERERQKEQRSKMLSSATDVYSIHISDLKFSTRAENVLRKLGWCTVGDICSKEQLINTPSVGRKTLEEIVEKLKLLGVELQ